MDLISLYYFQELSKDLNMTKTAQRLYISQQTLSNHIQRLEQHYGTKLLYRKPSLSLTSAGKYVLSFAQTVNKEERNLKDILSDVECQERGTLRIGASTTRGSQLLPQILPDFYRRYSQVKLQFVDGLSQSLEDMLSRGELDFAITLSGEHRSDLIEHALCQDPIYLCVPEVLMRQYYSAAQVSNLKSRSAAGASIHDFIQLPFARMNNRLGNRILECFQREECIPIFSFEAPSSSQILPLCVRGLCACYCSHMSLVTAKEQLGNQINIFPLVDQGLPVVQQLSILWNKQRYLTHYSKFFLDLLFCSATHLEQTQISHIVGTAAALA